MWVHLAILSSCVLFGYSANLPLPKYIDACHKKDPEFDKCVLGHAKAALPSVLKGDRKYGIPNFVPFELDRVNLNSGSLEIILKKVKLYGMENLVIQDVKFDLKEKKIHLVLLIPHLKIKSIYEMHGRILVIPLEGTGPCEIAADDAVFDIDIGFTVQPKDGVDFIVISEKNNVVFTVKKAHFNFENLFNGNEQLGNSTNMVLNENWDKIVDEVKPAIAETILTIAVSFVNNIVSKVSYNTLFPE